MYVYIIYKYMIVYVYVMYANIHEKNYTPVDPKQFFPYPLQASACMFVVLLAPGVGNV